MFVFFIILHKRKGADYSVINPLFLVYFFNSLLFEGPESSIDFQGFLIEIDIALSLRFKLKIITVLINSIRKFVRSYFDR